MKAFEECTKDIKTFEHNKPLIKAGWIEALKAVLFQISKNRLSTGLPSTSHIVWINKELENENI
jgi:hypothetical protein